MGDVLSLIEKAEQTYDEKKAKELEKKLREQKFTLSDYLEQFESIRSMGSIDQIVGMLPGVNASAMKDVAVDEKAIDHMEAIILSMTPYERENPDQINASRKKRIASGSGLAVEDVNKLLKQYDATNKLMRQLQSGGSPFGGSFGGKMLGRRISKSLSKKKKKKK